jgi:4-hydroxy-tetrahydrodipicolinate synthase
MFKGSLVAIITPFSKNGKIDEKGIKELVEFHIQNGTNGIVSCGTTGESPTLTYEEHERVIKITIKAVAGRVPVIAGTGSNCTQGTLDLTSHAKEAGADGALIITPYYNKPTQKGLYLHFKKIAEEVDLPIIIYNVPSRTGVNMLPETLAELAEFKNIIGVKEASGNLDQMTEIIELCGDKIILLSGDDKLLLPVLSIGGKGVISVVANIIPRDVSDMVREFEEGNYQKAKDIFLSKSRFNKFRFTGGIIQ